MGSVADELVPVRGAKVAYFNRHALERDFPFLKGLSDEAIETWILDNCAYVSQTQFEFDSLFQTPIPTEDLTSKRPSRTSYRPYPWNRAAIIPVFNSEAIPKPAGLIDVKGVGLSRARDEEHVKDYVLKFENAKNLPTEEQQNVELDKIRIADHANGLASLGEAIAEIVRQEALQRSFNQYNQDHKTNFQTVEHYFVIALPFDVLRDKGQYDAAALIGRQAHFSRTCTNIQNTPDDLYIDFHGFKQSDLFGSAVDMGGVFPTAPALRSIFLTPEQIDVLSHLKDFTQEQLKKLFDPQKSNAWTWGHDTAKAFREGPHNHRVVYTHLEKMLGVYSQQAAPPALVRDWVTALSLPRYQYPIGNLVIRTVLGVYPWSEDTWNKVHRIFSGDSSQTSQEDVPGIFVGLLDEIQPPLPQEILDRLVNLWLSCLKNTNSDENVHLRDAARRGLVYFLPSRPEILEELFDLAQNSKNPGSQTDSQPDSQYDALYVLGRISDRVPFSSEFRAKLIPLCVQLIQNSYTSSEAQNCLIALGPLDPSTVQKLITLTRDPQEDTRRMAMGTLKDEIANHPKLRLDFMDALIDSLELRKNGRWNQFNEEEILSKHLTGQDDEAIRRLLALSRQSEIVIRQLTIVALHTVKPSNPIVRMEYISTFLQHTKDPSLYASFGLKGTIDDALKRNP